MLITLLLVYNKDIMDFEINKPKLIKQITVDNPQQTAQAEQLEDER